MNKYVKGNENFLFKPYFLTLKSVFNNVKFLLIRINDGLYWGVNLKLESIWGLFHETSLPHKPGSFQLVWLILN